MQHGLPWRGEDVRRWGACEKLDGCRRILGRRADVVALRSRDHEAGALGGEVAADSLGRGVFRRTGQWETSVAAVVRCARNRRLLVEANRGGSEKLRCEFALPFRLKR